MNVSDYMVEEYSWTSGHQHDEAYINGYRIRIMIGKRKYYSSEKFTDLNKAIKVVDSYKEHDRLERIGNGERFS